MIMATPRIAARKLVGETGVTNRSNRVIMKRKLSLLTVLTVLAAGASANALEIGDPAPPLQVSQWIQGDPVDLKDGEGKTIYVLDFWATWSEPCRSSIPYLNALQNGYQNLNVVFIGISDEDPAKIKAYIDQMGDQMQYRVAADSEYRTNDSYMRGFSVGGVPRSFVINKDGRVVWNGHPRGHLKEVINRVITGTFDPDSMETTDELRLMARDYLSQARAGKSRVELVTLERSFLAKAKSNPALLNHFAWVILTDPKIKTRNIPLALEAAKAAYDATKGEAPAIIDTYARAFFKSGDAKQAIKLQQQALQVATDPRLKERLQKNLAKYQEQAK